MPHMMISGVGRSGTTALYDGLQDGVLAQWPDCRLHYEPYLWNLGGAERFETWRHRFQTTSSLSVEGIYIHKTTPLFLRAEKHPHARFVKGLYSRSAPNVLAKFIRAAGRLEAFLRHADDLKIVHICRDPIPTIEYALGVASFFGDEFHPSDRYRFVKDVTMRFGTAPRLEDIRDEVDWSLHWWSFMTRAALEAKERFPERILIVAQEQFAHDGSAVLARIGEHFGLTLELGEPEAVNALFDRGSESPTNLTRDRLARLLPAQAEYWDDVFPRTEQIVPIDVDEIRKTTGQAFEARAPVRSRFAGASLSETNPMAVRAELARARNSAARIFGVASRARKSRAVRWSWPFSIGLKHALARIERAGAEIMGGPPISCIVTSFNQAGTLKRAVTSLVEQTMPLGEILICDDASTDGSLDLIRALEYDHWNVRAVLRERNAGPALNRHLGITHTTLPFVTQIDGDDWFHPKKIEAEWSQLQGSNFAVAFSNTTVVETGGVGDAEDSGYFAGDAPKAVKLRAMLLRERPIPRDMLMAKDLYLKSGGYEPGVPMYEDWSLKLRLMNQATSWRHSGALGTYYDRSAGVLSHAPEAPHGYWKLHCIARNFDWLRDTLEPLDLLDGVQQALPTRHKIDRHTFGALRVLQRTRLVDGLRAVLAILLDGSGSEDDISRCYTLVHECLRQAVSPPGATASVRE